MTDANANNKPPRRRGRQGKEMKPNGHGKEYKSEQVDVLSYRPHKTQLIHLTDSTPTWYECGRGTASRDDTLLSVKNGKDKKTRTNSNATVAKYRQLADSIYQQEVMLFRANASSKDEAWVENTMKRGTLKDRVAAMSVVVSTSPVHKLYALDMLLDLAGVSTVGGGVSGQTNERVSAMAAEALTDLFSNTMLPTHRKLVGLESRPLYQYEETQNKTKRSISPRILLLWRYEEIMKNKYSAFLSQYLGKTLSQTSTSVESLTKINALRTACSLLKGIPEGEQLLLSLVANKVGDPNKKIASAAGHELRKILEMHPNMTGVIAREVQQLAHRPNLSTRALYNCIIFLNQLKLVKEEPVKNVPVEENGKKGQKSALPASLINTYFQIFEVAVNKTMNGKRQKSNAELDQAMKSRLLGALLTGVNRAHPYLPSNDTGMEQHIDSLYRIAHVAPPSACTQAFLLLFHLAVGSDKNSDAGASNDETVAKTLKMRKDRFYRALYSKVADPTMLFGRQLTLYFNLIYKAMKYDDNNIRIVAFGKRLLHTAFHYNAAVTSGALFLLSEVMKHNQGLASSAFTADGNLMKFDPSKREPSVAFSLATRAEDNSDEEKDESEETTDDAGSLWELSLSLHHYHPSVCKFASDIGSIEYNGDPLKDFTLAPFLDKLAFRNPKSIQKIKNKFRRGQSVGERRSGLEGGVNAASSLPVNDPDFWKKQKNSSEQDDFFQKFFTERAKRDELKGVVRGKKEEEADALDEPELKEANFDWDSDDSEEKFAQSLAEGLMKSTGEIIEYDNEDPDMGDWSDYGGSDDDDEEAENVDADVSAFSDMDGVLEGDVDAMMGGDSDEDSGDEGEIDLAQANDETDESIEGDELGLAFTEDLEVNESDDEDASKANEKSKSDAPESSFAELSEYEELINNDWKDRESRKRSSSIDDIGGDDDEIIVSKKSKKKRKRGKKKNKA